MAGPGVGAREELGERLSEADCMRLLATVRVGRVAVTEGALPVVLPVSFALDGSRIVIRTAPGAVLRTPDREVVVAFEADELDPETGAGWSVLVTGTMREITGRGALLRAHQLRLALWPGGDRHRFVRITPGLISGRRLGHRVDPPRERADG